MSLPKWLCLIILSSITKMAFTQQMLLGKMPSPMNKSAVLELNADNQGFLLPRIADTAAINALNPPDGMVIYFVPTRRLLLRTSGFWSSLAPSSSSFSFATGTTGADVSISGSPVALGGTVTLNLPSASASARGLLTSSDWNTFNNKQAALTFGNLSTSTSGVTVTGGAGAVVGSGAAVNIQNASSSQNGLLTSSDWNAFNNKQSAGNYLTELTGDVTATGPGSAPATIANNAVTLSKFQQVATGTILGRSSALTGNLEVLTTLPASTLPAYTGDVTKAAGGTVTTLTNNVVSNAKFRQSAPLSVVGNATNATANVADITAANDGEVLRRNGTSLGFGQIATTGISNNAVTYSKLQNVSANNRLLGRATTGAGVVEEIALGSGLSLSGTTLSVNSISGTLNFHPKFTSATTLGNSLIFDNGTNVGISTTNPSQKLDVNGNVRFSGALMPGGDAGTDGLVLRSRGAGNTPDWYDLNNFFSSAWTHNGNNVPNEKTFGTRSNIDLPFIAGNIERMRLTAANGYLGINTTAPNNFLEVGGTNISTGVSGVRLTNMGTATAGAFNNKLLSVNSTGDVIVTNGPNSVTSVGLSLPSIFSVTNSPVTSSGTLTASLNTQTANLVFASPASGAAAAPSFRSLVKADLPSTIVHTDQANTYTAGMKQNFQSSSTTAGTNWSGVTADPTTLVNGDVWHNTTVAKFKYRSGGTVYTFATMADVPTNNNQLTNGAGYITSANVVFSNQANTYTAGMKQTFRGSSASAGVSFGGALTADPTTLATGDLWFRSDAGKLRYFDGTTARYLATEGSAIGGSGTLNYVPKFTPDGNTVGNSNIVDNGTNIGINTASPNATLDINGDLALRLGSYTAVNGLNHNINLPKRAIIRVEGITSTSSITSIDGGFDGRQITLFNTTSFDISITHESADASVVASNRIWAPGGVTAVIPSYGSVSLVYSSIDSRWLIIGITK